jgi:hypothetical protein
MRFDIFTGMDAEDFRVAKQSVGPFPLQYNARIFEAVVSTTTCVNGISQYTETHIKHIMSKQI